MLLIPIRLSLQITSYINEAYETLKDEYLKSLYLLKIKGYEINDQNNTISDPDFLMHQMELREELENLKKTKNKIEKDKFTEKIIDLKKNCLLDFTKYFKNEAFGDASKKIKKMKFYISIENDIKLKKIPLLGKIAAGTPIEAISNYDNFIEIPTNYSLSNDSYALTVEGDSMIDEGILDGDVVIIDNKVEVKNGDIVVALIDKEEATLKKLRKRGDSIALEPANKNYKTQIYGPDRVTIQGRLKTLIREY